MDLVTEYLGQKLKNPIIVGACTLTSSLAKVKDLEKKGVGAVVLQTLFEDQLDFEDLQMQCANKQKFPDSVNYIDTYVNEDSVSKYCKLIKDAKEQTNIPIFASLNCHSGDDWLSHAKQIEKAGADGIELNVLILPCNFDKTGEDNENMYFKILHKARKVLSIPIALKMSSYSAGLASLVNRLSWTKNVDSFVLFTRFYKPDIDIDKLEINIKNTLSIPSDVTDSLRWTLLLSRRVKIDIVGNTGIHSGRDVIKHILSGAKAVEVVSELYKNENIITEMVSDIEEWMVQKNFKSVKDFRGLMHEKKIEKNKIEKGFIS